MLELSRARQVSLWLTLDSRAHYLIYPVLQELYVAVVVMLECGKRLYRFQHVNIYGISTSIADDRERLDYFQAKVPVIKESHRLFV